VREQNDLHIESLSLSFLHFLELMLDSFSKHTSCDALSVVRYWLHGPAVIA
jgi:hypothetical protein